MTALWRIAFLALPLLGCDRQPAPTPPPAAVTTTTSTPPATAPAAKIRVPATFYISEQPIDFPPAKLVVRDKGETLRLSLFSDDPPEAVRENYRGNSFYFDITLDAADVGELAGKTFAYRNDVTERVDSTTGLFLAGGRQILIPLQASVWFEDKDGVLMANVAGKFQLFEDDSPESLTKTATVRARLTPDVVLKTKN